MKNKDDEQLLSEYVLRVSCDAQFYSPYIEETLGVTWAKTFAFCCETVLDSMRQVVDDLRKAPVGATVTDVGWEFEDFLPEMYAKRYDHEFMVKLVNAFKLFAGQCKDDMPRRCTLFEILARIVESEMDFVSEVFETERGARIVDMDGETYLDLLEVLFGDRDVEMFFAHTASDDTANVFTEPKGTVFDIDCWFELAEF